jgi:hypothetical protein
MFVGFKGSPARAGRSVGSSLGRNGGEMVVVERPSGRKEYWRVEDVQPITPVQYVQAVEDYHREQVSIAEQVLREASRQQALAAELARELVLVTA